MCGAQARTQLIARGCAHTPCVAQGGLCVHIGWVQQWFGMCLIHVSVVHIIDVRMVAVAAPVAAEAAADVVAVVATTHTHRH